MTPVDEPVLLERDSFLAALDACLDDAAAGRGRLVLIAGEAGIGKSTLVRRFCADRGGGLPILWGACDTLRTPRPLGPFVDIAGLTGGELADVVDAGARPQAVFAAFVDELAARAPTVAVI